jgi:hypothetical protein
MMDILFPVGRMIGGSVYKAQPVLDNFKKPKLNADGTPRTEFNFGVAIAKQGEQHWSQTPWGAQVFGVGAAAHPQTHRTPTYAWKIVDGDSTVPNKTGRIPRDQEGYAGHWVIWFKQSWAPKLCTDKGETPLIEADQIIPGYYVEVYGTVVGNGTSPSPGVYINPVAVNRVAFGEKMATASVDTKSVGFGAGALPAGASLTPVGGGFVPPVQQQAPYMPPMQPQAYAAPAPAMAPPPNPAILGLPPAPAMPAPPPAAPVRTMTAKANGATFEAMLGAGWTEALMREHGYLV